MLRDPVSRVARDMQPSGIRKFFDIVAEMPNAISLGVGEPDFDTPWHIREAGIYSLEKGRTFYTSNAGLAELRNEIGAYYKRKYDLEYDTKNGIFVTVGGSEAIDLAIRCVTDPGDEILVPEPSFVCYGPIAQLASGGRILRQSRRSASKRIYLLSRMRSIQSLPIQAMIMLR